MAVESNIFKRTTCGICGNVEYKPYVGQSVFDGGYTRTANFEKTEYKFCNVGEGERSFYACPKCYKNIVDSIDSLKRANMIVKKEMGKKDYE